ncbi:MAG: transposase family protein [Aquificaceae bacterium]
MKRARKSSKLFRYLVGMSPQAFDELMAILKDKDTSARFKLPLEERVFMTLFYLRHRPTFALLSLLFDIHESSARRTVQMMKEFLKDYISFPEKTRKKRTNSIEGLMLEILGLDLLINKKNPQKRKTKKKKDK